LKNCRKQLRALVITKHQDLLKKMIEMIKWIYKDNLIPILALFNVIMDTRHVPKHWRVRV
jgi:hypothetical protein